MWSLCISWPSCIKPVSNQPITYHHSCSLSNMKCGQPPIVSYSMSNAMLNSAYKWWQCVHNTIFKRHGWGRGAWERLSHHGSPGSTAEFPSKFKTMHSGALLSLRFAWGIAKAKCILATAISVCLSVQRCIPTLPHYSTHLDVTLGNGKECPLLVQYWTNLQLVPGFHYYGNIHTLCPRKSGHIFIFLIPSSMNQYE